MCIFPRIFESLPPLPRQYSAAIGCTKNYQPIGGTVHSHFVESVEGLLQRCKRGRCCSELWKTQFFLNTLYVHVHTVFFFFIFIHAFTPRIDHILVGAKRRARDMFHFMALLLPLHLIFLISYGQIWKRYEMILIKYC